MSLFCPICGQPEEDRHKCDKKILRRINRAHANASVLDEDPEEEERTEAERLEEGFRIMRQSRPDERE